MLTTRYQKLKNFQQVYQYGKKYKSFSSQIIVYASKIPQAYSNVSIGIVALKKIVGKQAVLRNKAKRRYRHGLCEIIKNIDFSAGLDIKIIALTNKNTIYAPWEKILADIKQELDLIKSYCECVANAQN